MDRETATAGKKRPRQPGPGFAVLHTVALAIAGVLCWLTADLDRWRIGPLVVLAGFTVLSVLTDVGVGASRVTILRGPDRPHDRHHVLLGPGPAALLGAGTVFILGLRYMLRVHVSRNNIVVFAWFPLIAAMFFHAVIELTGVGPSNVAYYLVVFLTFVVALTLNIVGVFAYMCRLDRIIHRPQVARRRAPGHARTVVLGGSDDGRGICHGQSGDSWDRDGRPRLPHLPVPRRPSCSSPRSEAKSCSAWRPPMSSPGCRTASSSAHALTSGSRPRRRARRRLA